MKNINTIRKEFILGKWFLVVINIYCFLFLIFCAALAFYQYATGNARFRGSEPMETVFIIAIFTPHFIVMILNFLLTLFIVRIGCQAHRSFMKIIGTLFLIMIPVIGILYYQQFREETVQILMKQGENN